MIDGPPDHRLIRLVATRSPVRGFGVATNPQTAASSGCLRQGGPSEVFLSHLIRNERPQPI